MNPHRLKNAACVLVGMVLACACAAVLGGLNPLTVCPNHCATLNGLAALMGPEGVRWLTAAALGALALGFTLKGLQQRA